MGREGVGWSGLKPPRLPGTPGRWKAPAQRQHPEPRVWWRQSGEDSRAAQPHRFSVLDQPCVKDQLNRSGPPILQPALPRWAPARVSGGPGEASPAVPGVRGPGSGPAPMGPVPGVQGGFPGLVGPCPDGPRPGCPGRLPRGSRGSGAPGRPPRPHRVVRGPGSGPPACPAPMGPGPGVRGGPRGQGPRGGPSQPALPRWAPAGPPGTPSAPRAKAECVQMAALRARPSGLTEKPGHLVALRAGLLWRVQMAGLPRPSWGSGAPGRALPSSRLPCPDGPRPGCLGRLPRPLRGSGAPGRALQPALPRWAPARVSGGPGEASPADPGLSGPGLGPPSLPCPDGPRPVPQGPRRLLELKQSASRWPPSEPGHLASLRNRGIWSPSALVCYGASRWPGCPGRPGGQGPRVGPSHPPGCPAPPRWAPARVGCLGRLPRPLRGSGAPGRALPSSRLPFPDGPRPGCPAGPRRPPRPLRVVRGPGLGPPACPSPMGPGPGVRWAPAGPPGTPSAPRAPRAKAECVQMAALLARPSGLTENPGHLVALRAGLLWRVQMAGLPRKSR
ncbi:hypothetical protein NDU88_004744 [Pleurodeles waltl]|uniref:Basic proline-rich protein-like n=1 Tax=Pleurodeles waltl TaxID=8319 RepID=A0AAV7NLW0_PLEWA|nr:hypothetical protein NDU88_004744 [Pleurodeles waltl]